MTVKWSRHLEATPPSSVFAFMDEGGTSLGVLSPDVAHRLALDHRLVADPHERPRRSRRHGRADAFDYAAAKADYERIVAEFEAQQVHEREQATAWASLRARFRSSQPTTKGQST